MNLKQRKWQKNVLCELGKYTNLSGDTLLDEYTIILLLISYLLKSILWRYVFKDNYPSRITSNHHIIWNQ